MGPRTLEALRVELDDLTQQVEGFSKEPTDFWLSGTQQAVIRFRIQFLLAMLDEVQEDETKLCGTDPKRSKGCRHLTSTPHRIRHYR
jgi:hypothetical protein